MPAVPSPVYQLATGRRWSIGTGASACAGASRTFVTPSSETMIGDDCGATQPTSRPPFSVERLRRESGFTAAFGHEAAFDDYLGWRRADGQLR